MRYSAILLALVAIAGCSDRSERHAADPRVADASRPLVFLTNPEEPPCSYVDASGQIAGSDVALARRIAAKMGRKLAVEGVPAAMFMMRAKTLIKSIAQTGKPLAQVFDEANEALCEGNSSNTFVTVWAGELQLAPGDAIYLYTDGIVEQPDASGELYGDDRLLKTLSGSACRRQDLLDAVIADVRRHAAGAEQADDCTQLVIRYCGEPPAGGGLKG